MITINKRQKQVRKSLLKDELQVIKEIEKSYTEAIQNINGVIANLLARKDTENLQSIIYQVRYQNALKKELEAYLSVLHTKNYTLIDNYLTDCYKNSHIGTLFDLQGQGIPLLLPLNQEQIISAVTLNSKLSEPLYNSLGFNVEFLKTSVRQEISRGIAQSLSYAEMSRRLENTTKVDYNKTLRITKTEGHRIQNESAYNVQVKAKEMGANIMKQWDATLDSQTRHSHQKVDGEIVDVDAVFSNGLLYPGDPDGMAKEVINCRCGLLQRAKWSLTDREFTKMNGSTNTLQHFENVADYDEFKKIFWNWEGEDV